MIFEFFLIKYLLKLFGGIDEKYIILIILIFGILNIIPTILEDKKSHIITRTLDKITKIWIWFSLFILFDIVIIYILSVFININKIFIYLSLILILIIGFYNIYKAYNLVINERTIELENLDEEIKIVHLSDIHFGSIRHGEIIDKISNKLNELSDTCDLAIISGDLTDGSCIVEEDDLLALKNVDMPILFTPGNHDFYYNINNVYKACENADIIILDNDAYDFNGLNIFGLSYSFENKKPLNNDEIADFVKKDNVNILIYHVPENWENFSKLGFNLQLSGHTHGGQFYPVVWLCDLIFYNKGLFKQNINNILYYLHVTTGVGIMDYPMRWGTDSELVILKLTPKKKIRNKKLSFMLC